MDEREFKQTAVIEIYAVLRAEHPEIDPKRIREMAIEEAKKLYEDCMYF